jgi:hypothetical protein
MAIMRLGLCKDCVSFDCDCEQQIWSFRFRYKDSLKEHWAFESVGTTRACAVHYRECVMPNYPDVRSVEIGPVQRMTDPPHVFENVDAPPVEIHKVNARLVNVDALPPIERITVNFQKVDENRITVTQPELARLLFDGSRSVRRRALEHAEIVPWSDLNLDVDAKARLNRVLDIMWDKTHPEDRALAERRAAAVFARAKETDE